MVLISFCSLVAQAGSSFRKDIEDRSKLSGVHTNYTEVFDAPDSQDSRAWLTGIHPAL